MSYRSIKRVLGETSLERKCRFLFGACLLVLITASFWWYGTMTEDLVYQQNRTAGELLVDQALSLRHFQKWAWLDDRFASEEEKKESLEKMAQELTEHLTKDDVDFEFITNNSMMKLREDEDAYDVAQTFIKAAEASKVMITEPIERFSKDRKAYHYYQPVYADIEICVRCHVTLGTRLGAEPDVGGGEMSAAPQLKLNDLMAIARVTIPNEHTEKAFNENRALLMTAAVTTVFLAMIASYVIVRYVIVKPLRHLRDVSDAVSHGDVSLRAEIHTGDEFESLAVAFNRMLRHLVNAQEELRQVNADLDGKVDELAQVNMRLYEMNTIKSDFLATMSHELRTPLNSILGFSDVLESIDLLDDKQRRYVRNIQTSGRILLDMINDILDLAKIESGKMDTRLTDFGIEQIIHAQCDMARPLTEKKNIDVEARVQEGLPPMHQDQARVQQILNNLLSNAIKFTPEGGRITVSASCNGDEDFVLMQVSDTGVGIAEDDQQVIFEKFRQGHTGLPGSDAMTREYSGTGLGLSIVKELCKLLGGEVSVQSELGQGSTFTVRLPQQLQQQPRLDSALVEGFEEFTKPRFDVKRERPPLAVGADSQSTQ